MGYHTNMYSFTPCIYTHRVMAENSTPLCLENTKEENTYKYYISIRNPETNTNLLDDVIDTLLDSEVVN